MTRVIVAGGTGFFGSRIVHALQERGIDPLIASRSSEADLQFDVEKSRSLEGKLKRGDVVIDTVGPFQERSPVLVEAAVEQRFHLIDIADSISYVRAIYDREKEIREAGIQVRTACSAVSTLPAIFLRTGSITEPTHVRGFLAPATAYADYPATARALLHNIGRPIQVFEDGELIEAEGWSQTCSYPFPDPVGIEKGFLFESTDSFLLPRDEPSLESVTFYACPRSVVASVMLSTLRHQPLRWLADVGMSCVLPLTRWTGKRSGGIGYEIRTAEGQRHRYAVVAEEKGLMVPVLPPVLAAEQLLAEPDGPAGLCSPAKHVQPEKLFNAFSDNQIQIRRKVGEGVYKKYP